MSLEEVSVGDAPAGLCHGLGAGSACNSTNENRLRATYRLAREKSNATTSILAEGAQNARVPRSARQSPSHFGLTAQLRNPLVGCILGGRINAGALIASIHQFKSQAHCRIALY